MPQHGKNIDRDAELSKRIYERNVPNKPVQMYFSSRASFFRVWEDAANMAE